MSREILAHEDRTPARRSILVGDAGVSDLRREPLALVRVEAKRVGDAAEGVLLFDAASRATRGTCARHDASGHEEDVEGRAIRREHASERVAHDASCGRQRDAPNDVLVRRLCVLRAVEDLELEETADDDREGEEGHQRDPSVALPELADVGARNEEVAHQATSLAAPVTVAAWIRPAMRKTSGATRPVTMTCGSVIA